MKKITFLILTSLLLLGISTGQARNEALKFSIESALSHPEAEDRVLSSVRLYFGDQATPEIEREIGTYTSNKKTNAFNKSDKEACDWAFLSAVLSLQERAIKSGGNAVVNIRSFYYKNHFSSETEYECGAGNVVAGVTLMGDVVKLAD